MFTIDITPRYKQFLVTQRFSGCEGDEIPNALLNFDDCQAIDAQFVCNAEGGSSAALFFAGNLEAWEAKNRRTNTINRIEFLWHSGNDSRIGLRGAVLYDSGNKPFAHFVNALIGYEGPNGPGLSRKILKTVGASDEIIARLNVRSKTYRDMDMSHMAIVERNSEDGQWHDELVRIW